MSVLRSFAAVGISLSSALVSCGQTAPSVPLSESLRNHLKNERFAIVTSIRGLPLGVREDLQRLWVSPTLDIAEPGDEFRGADGDPELPSRRLVAAGCAPDHHCLIYYERAGSRPTWLVALYHWTPAATRFEWGGAAPGGLETIEDVQKAALSGAIGPNDMW